MQHTRTKVMQLTAELVDYFVENRIQTIDVHFDLAPDHFTITVRGRTSEPPEDLDQLTQALTEGRQPDMDEYYDHLVGCEYRDQGYHMLGALVDESEVRFTEGLLSIRIRQNGRFDY